MTLTDGRPKGSSPELDEWLHEHGEGLVATRRQLHANPELSGEEHATTALVMQRLELAGLRPRRLRSGTGLVCDVVPPEPTTTRMLALRADLDALAMADEKEVDYRSRRSGVAHACGHDVHTSIALGTALFFAHHSDRLPGPLRFLFQPAEERVPGGALDVIADDGLTGVDAIFGFHCEPKLDVGTVGLKSGPVSSAADMLVVELSGPGGHTARPELTVDLLLVAARIVADLPIRVASMLDDPHAVKVVFGAIRGGDAPNVIPSHCELRGSVRTPAVEVWEALPQLIGEAIDELVADTGAEHRISYTHGVPPVVNDADVTAVVERAARTVLGPAGVVPAVQSWGGDDFAWFTREVPGTYVRLGTHRPDEPTHLDLHAGHFDVDERSIELGVRLAVATTLEYFGAPPTPRSDEGDGRR